MCITRVLLATLAATTIMTASAAAGGYSRGAANLDPFFETGTSVSAGITVVAPDRNYETVNGVATGIRPTPLGGTADTSASFTETYYNAGATAAFDIYGGVRCGGSFAQPYGAKADYGWAQILSGSGTTTSSELKSYELGATCSYGLDAGPGKLHLLGGIFYQSVSYDEQRGFGFGSPLNGGDLAFEDDGIGYRLGVGYTIPDIALKASLVYRSSVDHDLTGIVRNPAFPTGSVTGFAAAETPQSLKLSLQSGVAPGWLVFGSVEWTDWSVVQQIQVFADPGQLAAIPVPLAGVTVDAFFNDGWTVNAGVGHKFTEQVAGSFSITWDRGTSNDQQRSSYSDTWTFAVGAAYDPTPNFSIRGGVAYTLLTDATENKLNGSVVTYGNDNAFAGGLQLIAKF